MAVVPVVVDIIESLVVAVLVDYFQIVVIYQGPGPDTGAHRQDPYVVSPGPYTVTIGAGGAGGQVGTGNIQPGDPTTFTQHQVIHTQHIFVPLVVEEEQVTLVHDQMVGKEHLVILVVLVVDILRVLVVLHQHQNGILEMELLDRVLPVHILNLMAVPVAVLVVFVLVFTEMNHAVEMECNFLVLQDH